MEPGATAHTHELGIVGRESHGIGVKKFRRSNGVRDTYRENTPPRPTGSVGYESGFVRSRAGKRTTRDHFNKSNGDVRLRKGINVGLDRLAFSRRVNGARCHLKELRFTAAHS